jgi:hypothetical protein
MKFNTQLGLLSAVLLLSACSGGTYTPVTQAVSPPPPPPAPAPAPKVTFAPGANSVLAGQAVTLSWASTNATACTATGAWTGSKATSGNENVTVPTGANSYTLTCTGAGGSDSKSVSVTGTTSAPVSTVNAVKVLSNRADLISSGDALIEVVLSAGAPAGALTMDLNGHSVTDQVTLRPNGRYMGLVSGLVLGSNNLTATLTGGSTASTSITNHPHSGPVLAGPQLQPWTCRNAAAVDAACNQLPVYDYFYKSTDPSKTSLQTYNPASPPSDVASTTTDNGTTVPFIVRVETGYQDRDQYKIAVLFQPGQPWTAWTPQPQFNHKLVITHGVSCGVDYQSGSAPSVISFNPVDVSGAGTPGTGTDSVVYALGKGFAIMSTALNHSGHNCNVALQAESLVMAKERLIEQYSELRYTIGTGCSGGSLAQQWIANAYPGVYQGILPTCSFADAWGTATQFADYHLLLQYFLAPSKWGSGVAWTSQQMADVEGHVSTVNAEVSEQAQFHVAVPTDKCAGISDAQRYNPSTNPRGVRCSVQDAAINLFGPRLSSDWGASEIAAGHGFTGFPLDNNGVQYGLAVLQAGSITPAQFVDINTKIGGSDIDAVSTPQRFTASQPALPNAYRTGLINTTSNLDRTAIIDCRGPDPGAFHDSYRAFAVRARLDREHGNHSNQMIWEGPAPIIGDAQCSLNSLVAMDRWLVAIENDSSAKTIAQKIVADKPADIGDQCWNGNGNKVSDGLCPGTPGPAGSLGSSTGVVPVYGTPRMVAGDQISTDKNKCQLKPLNRSDNYGPVGFPAIVGDAQWTQMQALFPNGVCDFSKPGVDQQPTIPWQTYQNGSGSVIYGGTALPTAPANSGSGWAAPAFGGF